MSVANSPLRYPGGKQVLSRLVAHLIRMNGATGGTYVEPYAGGAGVALSLLYAEHVERVVINDVDPCIHAFWKSVLTKPDDLVALVRKTRPTVREWERQREIYRAPKRHSTLEVGFATFFLNRVNRSGIIARGGLIGGRKQTGTWKLDARYNRLQLAERIERIAMYRARITLTNADAIDLLDGEVASLPPAAKPFVYLDPPYYEKGRDLYLSFYSHEEHAELAARLRQRAPYPWVLSYDNVPEIRELYTGFRQVGFSIDYHARERREGSEVMIMHPSTKFPSKWVRTIPSRFISSAEDAPLMPAA